MSPKLLPLVFSIFPLACIETQISPNEHHCANQSGDEWCADRHPDGSRPYCMRGYCEAESEPDPRPLDGCVTTRPPDDACYSPCGGASSYPEDATCLEPSTTTGTSTTTDSDPDSSTTTLDADPDPSCGDAVLDPDELCDDGDQNGTLGHCALDCQELVTGCGDGRRQPDEACDDGNAVEGDGCNPDCRASGAVVWEQKQVFTGLLYDIDISFEGEVYVSGRIANPPSRAWAARIDDRDGDLYWTHTLETLPGSTKADVFMAAHAIEDHLVVFAGLHGDQGYAVTLDEDGSFREDASDPDPSSDPITEIVDIGNGFLAKRRQLAVRYNYVLGRAWATEVGAGLAYRPGDDVALATPTSAASFRRFGLDGDALPPVEFPLPAGLSAQSQLVAWTDDGDVIVAGLLSGPTAQDAFVLRSSPAGDLRWLYGTQGLEQQYRQPLCLAVDDEGAVIVGGWTWVLASPRPFLMKLSPHGEHLWIRSLELTSSNGAIFGCTVNAAREILAVGQANDHLWTAKVTP